MAEVGIRVNGQVFSALEGETLLYALRRMGIYVPALCDHPALPETPLEAEAVIYQNGVAFRNEGGEQPEPCGLCVVKLEDSGTLVASCTTKVADGMVVSTESPEIQALRKENLVRILSRHPNICLTCDRVPRCPPFGVCVRSANVPDRCVACPGYDNCELLRAADHVGLTGMTIPYTLQKVEPAHENPFFDFDPALCIGCTRCVRLCRHVRGVGALGFVYSEGQTRIGTIAPTYEEAGCRFCMGCVEICPTGALSDRQFKWQPVRNLQEQQDRLVPCRAACPLDIDVPRYVYLAAKGRYAEALAVIEEKLPFPLLCGTICTHPCEAACRRSDLDAPVAIRDIKRFVAAHAQSAETPKAGKASGRCVAVVGSGPAGLAAAWALASKGGHTVTVFEALDRAGGMLTACIPRFRLPQDEVDLILEKVVAAGVEIRTGAPVESLDPLMEAGFDAICIATGAHREIRLGIEGEELSGVMGALALLKQVKSQEASSFGTRVAVIGGGNVALDAARTALRLGATEVTLLYRRSRYEMPADKEEIARAEDEGVRFAFLAAPTRITQENGQTRLHLVQTRLRGKDASGRPRAFPVRGSDYHLDVDTVISAIGQEPSVPPGFGLETEKGMRLKAQLDQAVASRHGVFAAGDVLSGPWNVAGAIATGLKAAEAIDRFLGGGGLGLSGRNEALESQIPQVLDQDDGFFSPRSAPKRLGREESLAGFAMVEFGLDEESTIREANRCLRCSLRLDLHQPGTPGNVHCKEEPQ